jgi:hypothetical protein
MSKLVNAKPNQLLIRPNKETERFEIIQIEEASTTGEVIKFKTWKPDYTTFGEAREAILKAIELSKGGIIV